jgi:cell surface protein SprA
MPLSPRHSVMRSPAASAEHYAFCFPWHKTFIALLIGCCAFIIPTLELQAAPATAILSLETLLECEALELEMALGFLSFWDEKHRLHQEESPLVSGLSLLSAQYILEPTMRGIPLNTLPSNTASLLSLQDSTRRAALATTTSATLRPTNATLSTTDFIRPINAAAIPLLSDPALNLDELADSLGVRRGVSGGAVNRKGIESIPFSGQNYNFQSVFDSTTLSNAIRMRLRDKLLGTEFRPQQTLPLDDYLTQRREYIRKQTQDSITHQYDFRRPFKLELSSLLGQANNFNIPFPQNPLTTIFGKPELRLNANFEINLRMGIGFNATLGVSQASVGGAVQPFPIFVPNIQSNVDVKIGDKLNLNIDFNTLRQFDFDNLTRIAYDGEPDEIFRHIEFGNVSLNSPSAFIGGSQALFGVRTDFQFGPVFLKTVASVKRGQARVATVKGGSVKQPIALRAYDYADNHFFVNIAHKRIVWPVYERTLGATLQATDDTRPYNIIALEVYESTNDLRDIKAVRGIALDTLRPLTALTDSVVQNGGSGTPTYRRQEKDEIFRRTINPGEVEAGNFNKLPEDRYTVDKTLGTLRIQSLRRDRTYGIAYRLQGASQGDGDDVVYGTLSGTLDAQDTTSKVILQLVYRPNMQPAFKKIWARQRQNVYFIGATNVSRDPKDTRINIEYSDPKTNLIADVIPVGPSGSKKVVTVLGVDRVNNTNVSSSEPDGVFDIHLGYIFDAQRGEITFPSLEPFRAGIQSYFKDQNLPTEAAAPLTFSAVYDTTRDAARLDAGRDRFSISGEVSGQASNRITLPNAFNLSPGGVKVKLNGSLLVEFQDYRVEYFTGQVEILNPQAVLPNANLEIEYEQNDAFNLATRSMVGARIDIDTKSFLRTRDFRLDIGMTAVNYTQDNPSARIRLTEEPLSNTMIGVDGQATLNADWLTKALDWLPFYDTKAASTFTAKGEVAWSLSDPNTRISEVASDGGKAAVYIDDFEATQRVYSLGVQPAQWRYASPPDTNGIPPLETFLRNRGIAKDKLPQEVQNYRGTMRWYRFNELRIKTSDVYPNRAVAVGLGSNQTMSALEVEFNPHERGIYNTNPGFLDRITYTAPDNTLGGAAAYVRDSLARTVFSRVPENTPRIWGGFMRTLSAFNLNFDNENMDFIEIVVRRFDGDTATKMYIDVGQISEDVIPNGQLDTEDGILPGRETPNGRIVDGEGGEDVGLDGLNNTQEKGDTTNVPPKIRAKYRLSPTVGAGYSPYSDTVRKEADPARDNYAYDAQRFSTFEANLTQQDADFVRFNGVEGNSVFIDAQFPDTEILNTNNGQTLSQADAYFRYEVNLKAESSNPQFVNRTGGNFVTYRIPLRGARTTVGNALFTNIQYVRVLWTGGTFKGQIADWRFVGSQWVRQPVFVNGRLDSTTLNVGFVGIEENSGPPFNYQLPPGVQRPIDRNNFLNPTLPKNEQSLLVSVNELGGGQERSVSRFFRPFDAFFYKKMKLFLHGKTNSGLQVPTSRFDNPIAFIRFGVDTSNYYEYNVPLGPDWQEVEIDLSALTKEKPIAQLNATAANLTIVPAGGLGEYRIKGSPTLTRIQFVNFGIRNPQSVQTITTDMWVNELRLVEPDKAQQLDQQMAAVGTATAKIADLGTVTATYNYQTPYFTRLEERFGNRNTRTTLAVTGLFGFERFFPEDWAGTTLPVSFTFNRSTDIPRFLAQNDVEVDGAARNEAQRRDPSRAGTIADSIRRRQQTLLEDFQIAVAGARLNIPSYFFLIRDFVNRITVDYNYVRRKEESPVIALKTFEGWRFRAAYSHNFQPFPIKPFGWAEEIPALSWLSSWTFFPFPNTLATGLEVSNSFQQERSAILNNANIPNILNFEVSRQLQTSWKITENDILSPTLDYSVNTVGSLVPLWAQDGRGTTPTLTARETWSNISSLFGGKELLNLGTDTRHAQNFRLTFRPKLPDIMGGSKFFTITGNFATQYAWERLVRPTPIGAPDDVNKAVGYQNVINATFAVRMKDLGNTLFPGLSAPPGASQGGFPLPSEQPQLLTTSANVDISAAIFRTVKSVFFDWEQFNITFAQQNNAINPGVRGGTGFFNEGPDLRYQLGLVEEPSDRARGMDLPDIFKRNTTIEMRTQRDIIPGLQVELSWLSKAEFNRNQITNQSQAGDITRNNVVVLETFGRSFFAFVNPFDPLEAVKKQYDSASKLIINRVQDVNARQRLLRDALNDAFMEGLELNPVHRRLRSDTATAGYRDILRLLPNLNFAIRWNGLENLPFFKGVLRSGSLESKYQGRYTATKRLEAGIETIDQQAVTSSFEPLIGITAQFDDKFVDGIMSGNLRWGNKSSFGIAQAQQGTVQSEVANDFTMQVTYTRRGFELPKIGGLGLLKLIGIDFEFTNDMEFSLQTTYRNSLRTSINVLPPSQGVSDATKNQPRRIDGTTTILFEPSVRYTISKQVTARLFFRYEANLTEGAQSPGSSTTQFGVDLRLNLSGGRNF